MTRTTHEPEPTSAAPPRPVDVRGRGAGEEATRGYERSPHDLLRLVVYGVVTVVAAGLLRWAEDSVLGFETDLVHLLDVVPEPVERLVHGGLEWFVLAAGLTATAAPLVTRRYRLLAYVVAASALAAGLMALVLHGVEGTVREASDLVARPGELTGSPASSTPAFAALTAAFAVVGPFVAARWRRAGLVTLGVLVVAHVLVSVQLPADVVLALPLGATCGAGVLLACGRPVRRPTPRAVVAALREGGLAVVDVHPVAADARSARYVATLEDGSRLFAEVLGEAERAADLLLRVYRFVRLKNVGDDRPFSSLRRAVEHRALVALFARDQGCRTPRVRHVGPVGADSMLLASELVEGRRLDELPTDQLGDDLLRAVWAQVAVLRGHGIAHRDLRRANVLVDGDGQPWLVGFAFAELAVGRTVADGDVAQLLAALALAVGPQRAVATAVDVLGRDQVAGALPLLQLDALNGETRAAYKADRARLEALQHEVVERCSVDDLHFEELERFKRSTVLTVVVLVAATYFLLPQFADLPAIVKQVRRASWAWAAPVAAASAATYLAAALATFGSVPRRLQVGPTIAAQVASSFAGLLAPASLGGMALDIRFLQKQGVDRPVAVSAVGLDTVAGLLAHVSLIGVFVVWAGTRAFGGLHVPDVHWFLVGAAVSVVLAGVGAAVPAVRALVRTKVVPVVVRAADGVTTVLRRPAKLALLLGGSALLTVGYLLALYFATRAFGGGLGIATVGSVYLVGSAVATAAPTPGGLGAVEAALIGGLVAAGMDNAVAVPAVFLFRLATFWLPILPGWVCLTWMQHHDRL